jgi:hypothetical protein
MPALTHIITCELDEKNHTTAPDRKGRWAANHTSEMYEGGVPTNMLQRTSQIVNRIIVYRS